ncbi:hypothetical protein SSTG_06042 [Streptomyces sp. e14]|nr:hypothetical protein SSTG_06042 [Streptomyces sp. e14]
MCPSCRLRLDRVYPRVRLRRGENRSGAPPDTAGTDVTRLTGKEGAWVCGTGVYAAP